ncbi:MAG: MFS transporter [Gammaproteobacteria bacterium]|nr:MFS transporter [Gammaproteobacteria bacterium]
MSDTAPIDPDRERALQHSIRDGAAYAVMTGAGESYLSAYAIHLRFAEPQMAMLASIPPLVGAFAQVFSTWLHRRFRVGRARIVVFGALGQALTWLPVMLVPLLWPQVSVPGLIAAVAIYHVFGNVIAPHWPSLMRPLVPEKERGRYFSRRTRITTLVSFAALLLAGGLLEWAREGNAALLGFLLIFAIAAWARLVSTHYLGKLPDRSPRGDANTHGNLPLVPLWRKAQRGTPFARFLYYYAGMSFATALSAPFFAVHMLRDLGFTYLEFMAVTAASVLAQFLTLNGWGRVSDAFGNRLILRITGWMIPFVPLLWVLSDNVYYLLLVQAFSGLAWGGFSLSAGSSFYDLSTDSDMSAPVTTANVINALAAFVGAHLGAAAILWMPDWAHSDLALSFEYPLLGVFLLSFAARLLVALLFAPVLREVRKVRRASTRRIVFRFTRFSALTGVSFDIAAFLRPEGRSARQTETNG